MGQYEYLYYVCLGYVKAGGDVFLDYSSTVWEQLESLVSQYPLAFLQVALLLAAALVTLSIWRKRKIINIQGRAGSWLLWSLKNGQVPKRYREEVKK